MKKILILPSNTSDSLKKASELRDENVYLIGASSVCVDFSAKYYDKHKKIPWITDLEFDAAIKELTVNESVDQILVTQVGIYRRLKGLDIQCQIIAPEINDLFGKMHQEIVERARDHAHFINEEGANRLSEIEITVLLSHFLHIPGNCTEDKFSAILRIGKDCPIGDFIEIGSFYGKSAFPLGWSAKKYNQNSLLCIDPWDLNKKPQTETHNAILSNSIGRIKSTIKSSFVTNLFPYLEGSINYYQGYSEDALSAYLGSGVFSTEEFGSIIYKRKIACLHIDGNHDYQFVKFDIDNWSKLLVPGAWLIVDDYHWCYGSGPQKATDEFIYKNLSKIDSAFFCGGAIFIKIKYSI